MLRLASGAWTCFMSAYTSCEDQNWSCHASYDLATHACVTVIGLKTCTINIKGLQHDRTPSTTTVQPQQTHHSHLTCPEEDETMHILSNLHHYCLRFVRAHLICLHNANHSLALRPGLSI
ncbi:hypothetical protein BC629DRAFT_118675 [Irpex lacteus]|nr:hypothetical protein BC629DRAFT_118675 [Irpex lacteus]